MNWTNIISVIAVDALFSSIILAFVIYASESQDHSSAIFGPVSDFAWLSAIIGAVIEIFFSTVSGLVIMGFQLSIPTAILFALIFNGLLGWGLFIYSIGNYKDYITYFYALVIIGIINAIVFSLFNDGGKFFQ